MGIAVTPQHPCRTKCSITLVTFVRLIASMIVDTLIIENMFFFVFFKYFYCISSDFSDLPDMTDEYIDLSVYALTGWLLYILHLTYIQK